MLGIVEYCEVTFGLSGKCTVCVQLNGTLPSTDDATYDSRFIFERMISIFVAAVISYGLSCFISVVCFVFEFVIEWRNVKTWSVLRWN